MNEREYDRIHNEGGEGYNPFRAEREQREWEAERARPKSRGERRYALLRELERKDCSIARECGTYNKTEVDALRAQIKALDAEEQAEFVTVWTPEETSIRRAEWNGRVKAGEITNKNVMRVEIGQGWSLADLKRAIKIHGL